MIDAQLYGLKIKTCWPLPSAAPDADVLHEIELRLSTTEALRSQTNRAREVVEQTNWFSCRRGKDGSTHLSWNELLEAAIDADGRTVHVASVGERGPASLRNYLFAQMLSFPLLQHGLDPLHAAVVMTPAGCLGLLGDSGAGKSTLTMALVQLGARVVTDDLMAFVVGETEVRALPGPPRVRLLPASAARLMPAEMPSQPMNRRTTKRVYELPEAWHTAQPGPLKALYLLEPSIGGKPVEIDAMHSSAALRELLQHTFNPYDRSANRMRNQLATYSALARRLPVRRLRVRRRFVDLNLVAGRLLDDFARLSPQA
jgi:hypothetical protein